jgi:hypothetical protein
VSDCSNCALGRLLLFLGVREPPMTPTRMLPNERCHRLKGAHVSHIWQYKPTTGHNYRIWYLVDETNLRVLVTYVCDRHP